MVILSRVLMSRLSDGSAAVRHDRGAMTHRVIRGFRRDRFRELREQAGMTVTDLARLAEVHRSTITGWEHRGAAPDVERLARVAGVLGVDVAELVDVPADQRMVSDLRIRKGLSQVELARRAGLSTTVVGAFERAEMRWNAVNAVKLAAVLDVTVTELEAAWTRARRRAAGTPA